MLCILPVVAADSRDEREHDGLIAELEENRDSVFSSQRKSRRRFVTRIFGRRITDQNDVA